MKPAYLTVSVDDGHPSDFRTAELLKSLGLQATFYIPRSNPERPVISELQMKELATEFEIGGHTLNHLPLKGMSQERIWSEIEDGKKWLEDCLGKKAVSFCYPRGKFTGEIAGLAKQAGFMGARTCLFNLNTSPENPYLWGLSTHACRHSQAIQLRHALLEGNWTGARNFLTVFRRNTDWESHFACALDWVEEHGGIAHLYLHSWEIDAMGQWDKLHRVLQNCAGRRMRPVTNGELFENWYQEKPINGNRAH